MEIAENLNALRIPMPSAILNTIHYVVGKACSEFTRDGIVLEKGAVLTEQRVDKNIQLYERFCNMWSVYPDLLIYWITPISSKFKLKFF